MWAVVFPEVAVGIKFIAQNVLAFRTKHAVRVVMRKGIAIRFMVEAEVDLLVDQLFGVENRAVPIRQDDGIRCERSAIDHFLVDRVDFTEPVHLITENIRVDDDFRFDELCNLNQAGFIDLQNSKGSFLFYFSRIAFQERGDDALLHVGACRIRQDMWVFLLQDVISQRCRQRLTVRAGDDDDIKIFRKVLQNVGIQFDGQFTWQAGSAFCECLKTPLGDFPDIDC